MGRQSFSDQSNYKHRVHSKHNVDDEFEIGSDNRGWKKNIKRQEIEHKEHAKLTNDLESIERKLMSMREEISHRIEVLTRDKTRKERPLTKDRDDQSIVLENDEVIEDLDEHARTELKNIDHALSKIRQGSYGVCDKCGSKIEDKRLTALAYATTCISCARDNLS